MWRLLAWSAHVSSRTNGLLAYQWACHPSNHSMAVAISKKERFIYASIALWTNAEGYYFGYSTWNTKPITEHSRNPRGTPGTASSNSQVARPCDFKVPWGRNRPRGRQEELACKVDESSHATRPTSVTNLVNATFIHLFSPTTCTGGPAWQFVNGL